ncbi:BREX-1 system adenine-specific DNA-methyltransferase PglX [Micrococcus terreus]|uniref:BREX-1 system adenine-specific DNA-methyltransferase PglX n=2 Tax=Micrococcus terreus TaxID=574650 RepID=UPI00301A4B24
MDTAPLKSFATAARTELIREVGARITAVLAQGSPERVEQPGAVITLERAIAAGGGGDKGRAHVADKVAYTWFNRIIALRFMDANGYTGIGVVSPAADQVGQPEILAAAKRGQVDGDVVKGVNATIVPGLLNGTRQPRPGVDAQAEAYARLLADYCRYWNRAMPFMFEREGDYTELLIPAALLAEDSVLSRSVKVLTEDACQDVEVIGWLYQFYISERKDEVFAGFKKNKKAGADEIPAATQLFTPHWIVRYLIENSVGRLWMLNHPQSRLVDHMDYYIAPIDEETEFLKITSPKELRVIDPACGSGHMLTYAFDLLYAIYEEEGYAPSQIPGLILTHNLYGTEIDPRAGALAAFALTMKAAAKRKLFLKNHVEPNVCVLNPISFSADELSYLVTKDGDRHAEEGFWIQFAEADTLGSLIQPDPALTARLAQHLATLDDEADLLRADTLDWAQRVITQATYLSSDYAVVVANPPYMVSGNMSDRLAEFAVDRYTAAKSDLMTMFIERAMSLVCPGGVASLVTRDAWMFLSRFTEFRTSLVQRAKLHSLAHFGQGVFEGMSGAVVQVVGICFTAGARAISNSRGVYVRLSGCRSTNEKMHSLKAAARDTGHPLRFTREQQLFSGLPGSPIAYWASDALRSTFKSGRRVEDVAPVRQGFQTGDNDRFMRFWFEVSLGRIKFDARTTEEFHASAARFAPYLKGGGFRKWYGNDDYVVAFSKSDYAMLAKMGNKLPSRGLYFNDSITWSALSSGAFGARYAGVGSTFSAKGACAFPQDKFNRDLVLAVLNSSVTRDLLEFMGATLDFNVGSLREIPMPTQWSDAERVELGSIVGELIAIHKKDWDSDESSPGFTAFELVSRGKAKQELRTLASHTASDWESMTEQVGNLQNRLDHLVASAYGLEGINGLPISLRNQVADEAQHDAFVRERVVDLVSYAVGCMFGRYSLDKPGLILADQGSTLQDYFAKVQSPTLMPDKDNVIPIVDGDWFEDDIVERFRLFLRAAFGEEHFEDNLRFLEEALGVRKNLREHFIKTTPTRSSLAFYDDHVRRYKKRPIYWLFSSPRGSFNALIYMHRYTPSAVSTVLTYLREYVTKLESTLQQAERVGNAKEAERFRKILVELNEYEHDTLYPLATQQVTIDLDDGVKANYPKFGAALKKIPGLEAPSD